MYMQRVEALSNSEKSRVFVADTEFYDVLNSYDSNMFDYMSAFTHLSQDRQRCLALANLLIFPIELSLEKWGLVVVDMVGFAIVDVKLRRVAPQEEESEKRDKGAAILSCMAVANIRRFLSVFFSTLLGEDREPVRPLRAFTAGLSCNTPMVLSEFDDGVCACMFAELFAANLRFDEEALSSWFPGAIDAFRKRMALILLAEV
jgi:hypothetical protein